MVSDAEIQALADRIAAEFRPERIVLFGSRAYGRPRPDSDVDLLVVMPFEGEHVRQAVRILSKLDERKRSLAVDLIVRRPEEVTDRLRKNDPFIREIIDEGRVLYREAA